MTFGIALYNQVDGALHDADASFGGVSTALVGDAPTKTVQHVTRTVLAADLSAHPTSVTIGIQPTSGTLNTDDLALHDVYLTYKRKLLPS